MYIRINKNSLGLVEWTHYIYLALYMYILIHVIGALAVRDLITIGITSCSTASVTHLPQRSTTTPLIQSLTMEYSHQQSTSNITIVSDTHTTTSPVTTLSVLKCLTTSSSIVTSVSGQAVSRITMATGMYVCTHTYMHISLYVRTYVYVCIYIILFIPSICMYACLYNAANEVTVQLNFNWTCACTTFMSFSLILSRNS